MPASRIFVSYVRVGDGRGAEVARQLIADLQASGAEIVTDNEMIADENFMTFLHRELPRCQYLILVQTPGSLKSLRVQTAVNMALTMVAQQRMRKVLRLIAAQSEGRNASSPLSAGSTFDASTDYPRARDKLFLELDLIQLDMHMSLIMPTSEVFASGDSPPPQEHSGPILARRLPNAPGLSPRERSGSIPGLSPGGWPPAPVPMPQPPIGDGFFPLPPVSQRPGPTGFSGNAAPINNFMAAGQADRPPALEGNGLSKFAALLTRPFKTAQTRIGAWHGKPGVDELETLIDDRPPPLNTTRQMVIRVGMIGALILVLVLSMIVTIVLVRNHRTSTPRPHVGATMYCASLSS